MRTLPSSKVQIANQTVYAALDLVGKDAAVPERSFGDTPRRLDKARRVVESQGVKLHRFLPSGRTVWTVVGSDCDFLIDFNLEEKGKEYCSCNDFYFRVLGGRIPECYHLLAAEEAVKQDVYSLVEFSDDELPGFMKALVADIFRHLS